MHSCWWKASKSHCLIKNLWICNSFFWPLCSWGLSPWLCGSCKLTTSPTNHLPNYNQYLNSSTKNPIVDVGLTMKRVTLLIQNLLCVTFQPSQLINWNPTLNIWQKLPSTVIMPQEVWEDQLLLLSLKLEVSDGGEKRIFYWTITSIYFSFSEGCYHENESHPIGSFFVGCGQFFFLLWFWPLHWKFLFLEFSCICHDDGNVECSDRCIAPLQPSGKAKDDPLCVEQFAEDDKCCVHVTCAGNIFHLKVGIHFIMNMTILRWYWWR